MPCHCTKRLFPLFSYNGPVLPPTGRIACAVSLALFRSHLITPGIFIGELTWNKRVLAEAEYLPTKDALYMHAQDGNVYVLSFILSLLGRLILVLRALYLAILFSPCVVMAPFSESLGIQFRKSWLRTVRVTLEKAGPAFIKWGQWAAARPDLFPNDLCDELAELHSKAPAHSFAYTKRTIEKAFGRRLSEIFDGFEEEPVASASVAQVYHASLKFRYPRQQIKPMVVAVKVRHPGVGEAIPVLVESYEHGEGISHYVDRLDGNGNIKTALAHIGTHALLKMLLVDNFIHADMHPGNILVRVLQGKGSGKALFKSKPHVIFLDVGMTAELSKKDRDNLMEFFRAVALRDGRSVAECTLRLSSKQNCPHPEAFIEDVDKTFKFWGSDEGDFIHPADCMQQLLEQVRRHRVNIDGNVCTVIVTTLVLEGWQRKLDPEYDVMQTLQGLLFKVDWADSLFYTIEGLMTP